MFKVLREFKVRHQLVRLVFKVLKELLVLKEFKVLKGHKVQQAFKERLHLEHKEFKVPLEYPVHKVLLVLKEQ